MTRDIGSAADSLIKKIAEVGDFACLDLEKFVVWATDAASAYLRGDWDTFDALMTKADR